MTFEKAMNDRKFVKYNVIRVCVCVCVYSYVIYSLCEAT